MPQEATLAKTEKMRNDQVINCAKMCTEENPKVMHVMYCGCGKTECLVKMKNTLMRLLPAFPVEFQLVEDNRGEKGYSIFVKLIYKKK